MASLKRGTNSHTFDDLAIWRTRLPQARNAVLPPSNNRPNPLVTETVVYVSVFSPGFVYALDRETGSIIWQREIPRFGDSSLYLRQKKLFAKTANTLFALQPETGETIWSFCPHGSCGESLYSAPTLFENRVFIGDRCGYLHCLDSETGRAYWKRRTNRAKNCDVNSTPVVSKGLVIVSTNAKTAVAYEPKTGEKVWTRKLDGPSHSGPLLCGSLLAVITDSIYLLKAESGFVVRKFTWDQDSVSHAASTGRSVVAILRGGSPPDGSIRLVSVDGKGIRFDLTAIPKAYVAFLSYASETKLIYVSHLEGIDIRRSETGVLVSRILRSGRPAEKSPVAVKGSAIYALTSDGYVYSMRHPV